MRTLQFMAKNSPNERIMAWHYTKGINFKSIIESKFLIPTAGALLPPIWPILWFSLNQHWEPTAAAAIMKKDNLQHCSMEETLEAGGGLIRFGAYSDRPESKFIKWPKIAKKARIPKSLIKSLEQVAYDQGSLPKEWLGRFNPFPVDTCDSIQVIDQETMLWQEVLPND